MSLIDTASIIKHDTLNAIVYPVMIRLGVQTLPAASLLIGEVTMSSILHYGVLLPSPIGIELLQLPSKMFCLLERRRFLFFKVSRIPRTLGRKCALTKQSEARTSG